MAACPLQQDFWRQSIPSNGCTHAVWTQVRRSLTRRRILSQGCPLHRSWSALALTKYCIKTPSSLLCFFVFFFNFLFYCWQHCQLQTPCSMPSRGGTLFHPQEGQHSFLFTSFFVELFLVVFCSIVVEFISVPFRWTVGVVIFLLTSSTGKGSKIIVTNTE